ncbi:Chromate transport protein [Mycoplasmopsis agalactiae PG2]|uniref:Chromate transport protein n=1 Tax=Mycoplasmopsis agalactiae (strain NCTC 10123 / CIP 59.7 / PG2) TaxID=347257 RepID=A5IZB7_MYCAP|nr:chromate transporter [Mycoplasmopsis agalactiae]CAL59376.1 Chromate transport protein [Mycoplasmopsis agalactiae PG2]
MTFLMILTTIIFIIFISLSVFGGGQIFMPIFSWLWEFLNKHFATNIDSQTVSNLFTISNATPGVFSTKLAFATGYLVANGHWWGFIFTFFTYLTFVLVPFLAMFFSMKLMSSKNKSPFLQGLVKIMNPVIVGIIGALIIQLIIGIAFPQVIFNKSISDYAKIDNMKIKAQYFEKTGMPILFIYVLFTVIFSSIMYKKKFPVVLLILINVVLAFLVFCPWLVS